MLLETLKFIAGVLFFGLVDLFLIVLWLAIVPGIIYGIVKGIRGRNESD